MFTDTTLDDINFRKNVQMHLPCIARQTDSNDHIGACVTLAVVIDHTAALKVLRACKQIHGVECETSDELQAIVAKWRNNLFRWIEIYHPSILDEVKKSF